MKYSHTDTWQLVTSQHACVSAHNPAQGRHQPCLGHTVINVTSLPRGKGVGGIKDLSLCVFICPGSGTTLQGPWSTVTSSHCMAALSPRWEIGAWLLCPSSVLTNPSIMPLPDNLHFVWPHQSMGLCRIISVMSFDCVFSRSVKRSVVGMRCCHMWPHKGYPARIGLNMLHAFSIASWLRSNADFQLCLFIIKEWYYLCTTCSYIMSISSIFNADLWQRLLLFTSFLLCQCSFIFAANETEDNLSSNQIHSKLRKINKALPFTVILYVFFTFISAQHLFHSCRETSGSAGNAASVSDVQQMF